MWVATYLPYGTKACMRPSFEGSRAVVMNGEGLCGEDKISTSNAMPCDAMRCNAIIKNNENLKELGRFLLHTSAPEPSLRIGTLGRRAIFQESSNEKSPCPVGRIF